MKNKIMLAVNVAIISAIFVMNYFYQKGGFDFTLKCICSGSFAALGIINFCYALKTKQIGMRFYVGILLGIIMAFLGDVLIGYDFIVGAGAFALGHICFVVAYCLIHKFGKWDFVFAALLFAGALAFLLLCPLLSFDVPVFKIVCIVYALIISTMLGKAIGNFIVDRNIVTGTMAIASALFFFSDLMLVFDWFIGLWDWTSNACMGTYYPALCFLALSMFLKTANRKRLA